MVIDVIFMILMVMAIIKGISAGINCCRFFTDRVYYRTGRGDEIIHYCCRLYREESG
jgi:hypothetical protein